MFKSLCDNCGEPATIVSKRFDKLTNQLGLEVVLLHENVISGDHHICERCLPELLLTAAKSFTRGMYLFKQEGKVDYSKHEKRYRDWETLLEQKEAELKIKQTECDVITKTYETKSSEDSNIYYAIPFNFHLYLLDMRNMSYNASL